ncbi:alpha/beta hydrolase [Coleofasciculus sp.]|uniref:alpha/beta hydrolase n=1 Tax=Coleofasciculus sp. TaxID=3100458 RepID=UPI003A34F593
MKPFFRHSLLSVFGAAAFSLQPLAAAPVKAEIFTPLTCSDIYLPVALAPGEPLLYEVYGQFCHQSLLAIPTVKVLVSGNTYNHSYWDLPYQPETYSYVNALTKAGYATFNIDRIGVGNSSRPPADQVTVQSNAYVLNKINQALRNDGINGVKFEQIINVGHSSGSATIIEAVSQYGGVDGVILTGFLHKTNPDYFPEAIQSVYAAHLDPRFSGENLPEGYFTTKPNTRGNLFHDQSNTDPQVIALDEATKETLTTGEFSIESALDPEKSLAINVPVLLAIGQNDFPFCSGDICDSAENVLAFESQFFAPQAMLQTYLLPDAGHSINLALNAPLWYEEARLWSNRFFGEDSTKSVPEPTSVLGVLMLAAFGIVSKIIKSA